MINTCVCCGGPSVPYQSCGTSKICAACFACYIDIVGNASILSLESVSVIVRQAEPAQGETYDIYSTQRISAIVCTFRI